MPPPIPHLHREEIQPLIEGLFHKGRSSAQADLYALKWNGEAALLKEFSGKSGLIRRLWGRFVIAREFRAMRRLHGIQGIPKILASVGKDGILMERLDADRIPHRSETPPPLSFFDEAAELVQSLHERGIGHGDLRRKNILIDAQAHPYLIDFATAVTVKPGIAGFFTRRIFNICEAVDYYQLAQMKADFYPEEMTKAEKHRLGNPPWYLRLGQVFKKNVMGLRKPNRRRKLKKKFFKWWYRGRTRREK